MWCDVIHSDSFYYYINETAWTENSISNMVYVLYLFIDELLGKTTKLCYILTLSAIAAKLDLADHFQSANSCN